ncbi:MAG: carboxypeptidase-like regulatory domain-containing protein [Tangfeifania sp.]
MKRLFTLLTIFTIVLTAGAQRDSQIVQTIKGKVVDFATNESVPFTNISIEGTLYGTASNQNGEFELKIPEEMADGEIKFSAVGFKPKSFPVANLFDKEFNIIKLESTSYDIEDVDITARSRVLERILRMAGENTPYNFIGGPFNLAASYENVKTTDDTTEVTQTAKVLIYDKTGYTNPSEINAYRMRKYEVTVENAPYRFSSGILNLDELLSLDWVRSASSVMNPLLLFRFSLKLEDEVEINGNPAWVIAFSQDEPTLAGSDDFHATSLEGKITIMKDDYSVVKIEGSGKSAKHNRQGKSLAVGSSNTNFYQNVTYDFSVTYRQLKPDVISINKNYFHKGKQVEEQTILTVEKVQTADVKEITARDYFGE